MNESVPRVAFFGTPDFALPALMVLRRLPCRLELVVTQPDRPAGRGQKLHPSPVKRSAQAHGLRILTPLSLVDDANIRAYFAAPPDVVVVAAYGKRIPRSLLKKPRCGFLNIHPSRLPRWRGASPIQAAIAAGDQETGVTLIQLEAELDTGPIVAQCTVPVRSDDTAQTLGDRLATAGASLLEETLLPFLRGERTLTRQNDRDALYCAPLTRADGRINWREPAEKIERVIRAFQPWPGAWTLWRTERVHLLAARIDESSGEPGRIADRPPLRVGCGRASLEITKLKFAGGQTVTGGDVWHGRRIGGTSFT